jgi:hypothetical protein
MVLRGRLDLVGQGWRERGEAPSTKLQAPEKLQGPNSERRNSRGVGWRGGRGIMGGMGIREFRWVGFLANLASQWCHGRPVGNRRYSRLGRRRYVRLAELGGAWIVGVGFSRWWLGLRFGVGSGATVGRLATGDTADWVVGGTFRFRRGLCGGRGRWLGTFPGRRGRVWIR